MAQKRDQNVLIMHGIGWGDQGEDYAAPLKKNIRAEFKKSINALKLPDITTGDIRGPKGLRFQAVYWSPITQDPEDELIRLLGLDKEGYGPKVYVKLRRQMIGLLGDMIAYEGEGHKVYKAIHSRIDDYMEQLLIGLKPEGEFDTPAPLTLIGHSLGSVIASDYMWDNMKKGIPRYHLANGKLALKNMFLLGSPLALYALRDNPSADRETLAASLGSPLQLDPHGGTWLNLYDPQDPIGFPLKPIQSYKDAGIVDYEVRAGRFVSSLTPASHLGYWRSRQVAHIVGHKLALDWAAINSPAFADRYLDEVQLFRLRLENREPIRP